MKARAAENVAKKYKAEERNAERLCDAKFKRAESGRSRRASRRTRTAAA